MEVWRSTSYQKEWDKCTIDNSSRLAIVLLKMYICLVHHCAGFFSVRWMIRAWFKRNVLVSVKKISYFIIHVMDIFVQFILSVFHERLIFFYFFFTVLSNPVKRQEYDKCGILYVQDHYVNVRSVPFLIKTVQTVDLCWLNAFKVWWCLFERFLFSFHALMCVYVSSHRSLMHFSDQRGYGKKWNIYQTDSTGAMNSAPRKCCNMFPCNFFDSDMTQR